MTGTVLQVQVEHVVITARDGLQTPPLAAYRVRGTHCLRTRMNRSADEFDGGEGTMWIPDSPHIDEWSDRCPV